MNDTLPFDPHVGPSYTRECFTAENLRSTTTKTLKALEWLKMKGFNFGSVAGIGHSGSLLVGAVSLMSDLNPIVVRKTSNEPNHSGYDMTGSIGTDYVFIDDLVSSGNSMNRVRDVMSDVLRPAKDNHRQQAMWKSLKAGPTPAEAPKMLAGVLYHQESEVRRFPTRNENREAYWPWMLMLGVNDSESTWEWNYNKWKTYEASRLHSAALIAKVDAEIAQRKFVETSAPKTSAPKPKMKMPASTPLETSPPFSQPLRKIAAKEWDEIWPDEQYEPYVSEGYGF